jgi:MoaA/NifB/PqqE/SkfB family radical SAM enzyme
VVSFLPRELSSIQQGACHLKSRTLIQVCGSILRGRTPALSIEVTRECPLACPGCYAYQDNHLGGGLRLDQVRDFKGQALVSGILRLVDEHRPMHVSLVGGEPLVRFRELSEVLPILHDRGVAIQLVTSAVRPIPAEWRQLRNLTVAVSVDGLQPEHDMRRKPATYERILRHIEGHQVTVHCTVTRQMTQRPGYLREFLDFWSPRTEIRKIWMSLYTPQKGEVSPEMLPASARRRVLEDLLQLRPGYAKLQMPNRVVEALHKPPGSPGECIFARTTRTFTADLETTISPCQFGGNPDCSQCGCFASAALAAVGRYRLPIGLRIGTIFEASDRVGSWVRAAREARERRVTGPAVRKLPADA